MTDIAYIKANGQGDPALKDAIQAHKRNSKSLFKLWAIALFLFMVVTIITGIITAK